jgi:hypothetical protein
VPAGAEAARRRIQQRIFALMSRLSFVRNLVLHLRYRF